MSVVSARAPARLDVIGGIADYSGSLVLELPLESSTTVRAQFADDEYITVRSASEVRVPLRSLIGMSYNDARTMLTRDHASRWAAYVIGTLVVLHHERGVQLERGIHLKVDSAVPAGKGVASSAALEVASMRALRSLLDLDINDRDLAILCQMAENRVVGAPCGVMDQMTSACGERGSLLALLCQPAEIVGNVSVPSDVEFWAIDSGLRHEVGGSDYGGVRTGAFMGLRILESSVDASIARSWNGYLANVGGDTWRVFRDRVPERLRGADFLHEYGSIHDTVTTVDPSRIYAVRQPTEHPIFEHERVKEFKQLLEDGATSESERERLGELMYEAHASYSACGLGSSGTDLLVDLSRQHGAYGAKITGGGSGGTVAVLTRAGSREAIDRIVRDYSRACGRTASIIV